MKKVEAALKKAGQLSEKNIRAIQSLIRAIREANAKLDKVAPTDEEETPPNA